MKGLCRHCGRAKINRPRGLCWSCYYKPGVRESIPSKAIHASKAARGEVDTGVMSEAELDAFIESQRATMPEDGE